MKLAQSVALVLLAAGATAPRAAGQATNADSARLQGTWTMISGSAGGYPMPAASLAGMKRVATGNVVTITMNGANYFTATWTLNPKASPRTIDYHMTAGPTAGSTQLGIYELRGDTVRFAFGSPGAARPTDFSSKSGDGRTVSTWARAKP